jgi:hypothetical protein
MRFSLSRFGNMINSDRIKVSDKANRLKSDFLRMHQVVRPVSGHVMDSGRKVSIVAHMHIYYNLYILLYFLGFCSYRYMFGCVFFCVFSVPLKMKKLSAFVAKKHPFVPVPLALILWLLWYTCSGTRPACFCKRHSDDQIIAQKPSSS